MALLGTGSIGTTWLQFFSYLLQLNAGDIAEEYHISHNLKGTFPASESLGLVEILCHMPFAWNQTGMWSGCQSHMGHNLPGNRQADATSQQGVAET